MDYKEKYIKYKNKYIKIKSVYLKQYNNSMKGGVLLPDISPELIKASLGYEYYIPNIPEFENMGWATNIHSRGNILSDITLLHIFKHGLYRWYFDKIINIYYILNSKDNHIIDYVISKPKYREYANVQAFIKNILGIPEINILENKIKLIELGKHLHNIYDNIILQKIGIAYHRLKVVLEKISAFFFQVQNPKDYDELGKQIYKLDKLLNILQTMIYNHILEKVKNIAFLIFYDTPSDELKAQEKLTLEFLKDEAYEDLRKQIEIDEAEYNNTLKNIIAGNPDFYNEPEYKIIISEIDTLILPVPDDIISQFRLPINFNPFL